jgi:hypothetical protein
MAGTTTTPRSMTHHRVTHAEGTPHAATTWLGNRQNLKQRSHSSSQP